MFAVVTWLMVITLAFFCQAEKTEQLLDPPLNVTLSNTSSTLIVRWIKPLATASWFCFKYEVNIQSKTINETNPVPTNQKSIYSWNSFSVTKRYAVRMRVRGDKDCDLPETWSKWTEPVYIGEEKEETPSYVLLIVLSVVTLVMAIVFIGLCKRYNLKERLFPPIPNPNYKILDFLQHSDQNIQTIFVTEVQVSKNEEIILILSEEMAQSS
nr:PREDICTED: interleukin-5 receptor subunit alpha-like [Latimeria chalumnae]|eukprot:XP_005997266.1 PREDICTED: interleukin-5 receptor subunit alpha-like [Latimeria chalumnae]